MNLELQATFYFFKWIAWFAAFVMLSNFLCDYEWIRNSRQPLSASGYMTLSIDYGTMRGTHLWNEGPIGYSILSLIIFSCCMFYREMMNFQKACYSLCHYRDSEVGR